MPATTDARAALAGTRRANWTAIAIASVLMMFSYFAYAASFIDDAGDQEGFDLRTAFIGLAIAPFVFIVLGFVSRNPSAPKMILWSMILLLLVGLGVGVLNPLLGAATAFAVGGALTLNRPAVARLMYWRWAAVAFTACYVLVLLLLIPPAGVFTGAVLPLIMIGFADEYAAWSASK